MESRKRTRAPISLLAVGPLIAVASASLKANYLKALIALARDVARWIDVAKRANIRIDVSG